MILHQELNHSEKVHQAAPHRDFELVIHVGYPKTATTWFQETVIKDPASGFLVPWDDAPGFAMDAFSLVNSFHDDANWARSFFEEGLRRCAGKPGIPIISQEALTGQPLNRQYNARYVADRLHAAFPRAKILIGIREQKSFAVSLYRMYIKLLGAIRSRSSWAPETNRPASRRSCAQITWSTTGSWATTRSCTAGRMFS